MELSDKQVSTPVKSWVSRAEGEHPPIASYSEPRSWVKRAVVEAEKRRVHKERSAVKPSEGSLESSSILQDGLALKE